MNARPAGFPRRAAAYLIDVALLYLYVALLLAASMAVDSVMPFHEQMSESYLLRHVISFATLTLPFVLYFIFMERSDRQGTFGKSRMNLRVEAATTGDRAPTRSVVLRNIVKFLPWEIAHTHIHVHPDFLMTGQTTTAGWVLGIGLPVSAMVLYAVMIAIRHDGRSLYELVSGTRTVHVSADTTRDVR